MAKTIAKIGLVSVSDRASTGVYVDKGIPALKDWLSEVVLSPFETVEKLIPDDRDVIEKTLTELVDTDQCDLVLTTGGTGPGRRDVTPESTLAVCTREMPGFGERMREISGAFVPTAILSRQTAGLREIEGHAALIINLPGQPKAIAETLEGLPKKGIDGIFAAVPYCIELIGGPSIETDPARIKAFRPKSASRPKITEAIIDEPEGPATSSIIMLHGLGADGCDFASMRSDLMHFGAHVENTRFVLPSAKVRPISMYNDYLMRAWYDLYSLDTIDREDEEGMEETWQLIRRLIAEEESRGVPRNRIFLGGFSQGGCMTLYTAFKLKEPIGGLFALSSYLPLADKLASAETQPALNTPIFAAYGLDDDVVAPVYTAASVNKLRELGADDITDRSYPDTAHHLCADEMKDLANFINRVLES